MPLLLRDEKGNHYAPILESLINVKANRVRFVRAVLPLLPAHTNGHKYGELIQSFSLCKNNQLTEIAPTFKPLIDIWVQDERISHNSYNDRIV